MRNNFFFVSICILLTSICAAQYKQALPAYQYEFPRDYFNHPEYRTEWWYYTGNVKTPDGRRFGFELTFFRQAVARDEYDSRAGIDSPWRIDDLYMAHLALTDINGGHFYHGERINRSGPGIAGVDDRTGLIWNGNWQVQISAPHQGLRALNDQFAIALDLTSAKPPVIHGRDGISRKAAGAGHASHYISLTRLLTTGSIVLHGTTFAVEGSAWMDHEFFSDAMDPTESGWDWLSLQLDDNTEVMLYRLRHRDGTVDPYSSATFIDAQGKSTFLDSIDFTMTSSSDTWTSSQTPGHYPIHWQISIPRLGIQADISTPLPDQEIPSQFGPSYWEGAIEVNGTRAGSVLHGLGYLEMTGYAAPMHE